MGPSFKESWNVSFRRVQDLDLVNFRPKDGVLLVSVCDSRFLISLLDPSGTSVASRYSHEGEVIQKGSYLTFPHHVIKVGEKVDHLATKVCDVSQGSGLSSQKYAGVVDIASFEAKSRANIVVNNMNPRVVTAKSRSRSWKITYSTVKDMDRGRMKAYDGTLELDEINQWLRLRCARGIQIGCRSLQKGDQFSVGAKLIFPVHIVRLGMLLSTGPSSTRDCMVHADSTAVAKKPVAVAESGLSAIKSLLSLLILWEKHLWRLQLRTLCHLMFYLLAHL
jgi:hypothetical protein